MGEHSNKNENQSRGQFDSGLACIVLLARLFELPADPKGLRHQFGRSGKPFDTTDILRAAKEIGLKAWLVESDLSRLKKTGLPCIAVSNEGTYTILARMADDKVLIQHPDRKTPNVLPIQEFESGWSGKLILLTRRARLGDSLRKFDISWFVPAIIKYRRFLIEVLLASFFIQMFALITPLFFQVVIDKVLVHKGLTTLDVLAIGLLVVSVFEVTLTGLRTYIFSHTTNRIDVELGAGLFRHLLRLPGWPRSSPE